MTDVAVSTEMVEEVYHGGMNVRPMPSNDASGTWLIPFELEWKREAACSGVSQEVFFPVRGGTAKEAKEICQGCSVRFDCLEYAINTRQRWGIWGGMSDNERRTVARRWRYENRMGLPRSYPFQQVQ